MSQAIQQALEAHLAAMTPALDPNSPTKGIAYENVPFTPTLNVPYLKANMLPAEPDNSTQGSSYYREIGIFQVSLYYPAGTASGSAKARAELVRVHFKRGTTLVKNGVKTIIIATPKVHPALVDGDRYVVPVSIRYQADIFT